MERSPHTNEFRNDIEEDADEEKPRKKNRSEFLRRWHELLSGGREKTKETEDDEETDDEEESPRWRRFFRRLFTRNVTVAPVEQSRANIEELDNLSASGQNQEAQQEHPYTEAAATGNKQTNPAINDSAQEGLAESIVYEEDITEVEMYTDDETGGEGELRIEHEHTELEVGSLGKNSRKQTDAEDKSGESESSREHIQDNNGELAEELVEEETEPQQTSYETESGGSTNIDSTARAEDRSTALAGLVAADRLQDSKDRRLRRQAKKYKREFERQQKRQDEELESQRKEFEEEVKKKDQEIKKVKQEVGNIRQSADQQEATKQAPTESLSHTPPAEKPTEKPEQFIPHRQFATAHERADSVNTETDLRPEQHNFTAKEQYNAESEPSYRKEQKQEIPTGETAKDYSKQMSKYETINQDLASNKYKNPETSKQESQIEVDPNDDHITSKEREYDRRHEIKDKPQSPKIQSFSPLTGQDDNVANDTQTSSSVDDSNVDSQQSPNSAPNRDNEDNNQVTATNKGLYKKAALSGAVSAAVIAAATIVIFIL